MGEPVVTILLGLVIFLTGMALLVDFRNVCGGLFYFFARFLPVGSATAGTFRLMGAGWILIAVFWIATGITQM